jgi:hypothetical protein
MTDEHMVLDRDTLANECMTGDLASAPDEGAFLDFDKGSDLCLVADLASVQVDELGKLDVLPQLYVRGNAHVRFRWHIG